MPATVVAVGYRRAPEHRCPAAVDDAQAAYAWVLDHREALAPGSPGRVVVAGDSAGGNNAAVLVRRLRDHGVSLPAYADALRAAGVPVEHRHWDGHLHGFLGDPATYDDADAALGEVATAVRRRLTTDPH